MELSMPPDDIWQAVLGELQLSLQRPVYDNWLRDTAFVAYEDGCFLISAKTAFAQEWLDKRMKGMIKRRIERLGGRSAEVRFIVRPDAVIDSQPNAAPPPLLQTRAEHNGRFRSPEAQPASSIRPGMTFQAFIVGEGNRFAHAAALSVAQNPSNHYNPLFIYGGVGLGKTHLLHAIGNTVADAGYLVRYVSSETFTNDLIEAIRTKTNVAFRQTYREVDVLLIDDIQFIQGKDSTQTEVFHTFNSLYAANKQIIIASDRSPHLLTKLEDRLRSRFGGGLTADLNPPDLEHRIAILQAKAFEMGVFVPEDVLYFIAAQYSDNVRDLQGALIRLTAYAGHNPVPLDLTLAQKILGSRDIPLNDDPDSIIKAVSDEFRVSVAEIKGPRRTKRIVIPRQMSMYLMRDLAQLSFPQIGEMLGGRDHTTAMHGADKMVERFEQDAELRNKLEKIRIRLRP